MAGGTSRVWKEQPTIFFKFSGTTAGVQDNIKLTTQIAKRNNGGDFIYAKNDQEAHDLWKARKDSLWSMLSLRREGDEVWSTDVAVPISRLPDIVEITKQEIDSLNLPASDETALSKLASGKRAIILIDGVANQTNNHLVLQTGDALQLPNIRC